MTIKVASHSPLRLDPETAVESLDWRTVFGRDGRVEIEIGIGKGRFLLEAAAARPEVLHLGVEWSNEYLRLAESRAEKRGLENTRFVRVDASDLVRRAVADASVFAYYVFYPDPWPKKRHHKRRIVQDGFVALIASRLRTGGVFRLATDWQPYADWMLETIGRCPLLRNESPDGGWSARPASRPPTRFELRGQQLGHAVRDLAFRRT